MKCAVCGEEFALRRNSKTCSPKCSTNLTARRQRAYHDAHPQAKRIAQLRYREVVHHDRTARKLNRAVRLLFALTGDRHL